MRYGIFFSFLIIYGRESAGFCQIISGRQMIPDHFRAMGVGADGDGPAAQFFETAEDFCQGCHGSGVGEEAGVDLQGLIPSGQDAEDGVDGAAVFAVAQQRIRVGGHPADIVDVAQGVEIFVIADVFCYGFQVGREGVLFIGELSETAVLVQIASSYGVDGADDHIEGMGTHQAAVHFPGVGGEAGLHAQQQGVASIGAVGPEIFIGIKIERGEAIVHVLGQHQAQALRLLFPLNLGKRHAAVRGKRHGVHVGIVQHVIYRTGGGNGSWPPPYFHSCRKR